MKLEIGYKSQFEIRKYELANKNIAGVKIVYLSDFHFNKYSQAICYKVINKIQEFQPDLILLGGDYVDYKSGFYYFEMLLQAIKKYTVYAIGGNHDYFYGIKKVKQLLIASGAHWIEKKSVDIQLGELSIQLDGNLLQSKRGHNQYQIAVLHKPLQPQIVKDYDLVFAGHLHGGQFVLWQKEQALYPGKIFYPINILEYRNEHCNYFISKGLGDTLPLRYNCSKDIVLVTFK